MTTAITSLLQVVKKCYDSLNMSLSNKTAKFLFCCAVKEAHRVSHGGRGGKVRSGKLEGRGGQHFSLLEILSSSRRTQWVQNIFEFIFLTH